MKTILADYDGTYDTYIDLEGRVQCVVTGKGWDESDTVQEAHKLDIPIFFNPMKKNDIEKGYPLTVVNHKANIINKIGASVFFEDQPSEVALLKVLSPKCKIVLVKPGIDVTQYI